MQKVQLNYIMIGVKDIIYRKIRNGLKLILWEIKHKNKYDYSICFATHSKPGALITLNGSKNNAIWIHGNYCNFFNYDIKKMKVFTLIFQNYNKLTNQFYLNYYQLTQYY